MFSPVVFSHLISISLTVFRLILWPLIALIVLDSSFYPFKYTTKFRRYTTDDPADLTVIGREDEEVENETAEVNEEEEKARKAKRAANKLHKEKVASYLSQLYEQKKKMECDKKKKEECKRRRVLILSARVQNEAAERRLMSMEDKPQQRVQVPPPPSGATNAILLLKAMREKEKEKRISQKEKDRDRERERDSKEGKERDPIDKEGKDREREKEKERQCSKVSAEEAEAIVTRLTGKGKAEGGEPAVGMVARDFADWKKKNSVQSDTQVRSQRNARQELYLLVHV
jgi:hypothetical protein